MTHNTNLQLIQLKIIHRTHYTGQNMFGMGLKDCHTCLHCIGNVLDHHLHTVWQLAPILAEGFGCTFPSLSFVCFFHFLMRSCTYLKSLKYPSFPPCLLQPIYTAKAEKGYSKLTQHSGTVWTSHYAFVSFTQHLYSQNENPIFYSTAFYLPPLIARLLLGILQLK